MKVQSLHIYPIKSLGGISLKKSKLTKRGLYLDRRYMLVDEDFKFLTQRSIPEMALFQVHLKADMLSVNIKQQVETGISFSVNETGIPLNTTVEVWDSQVKANGISDEIDRWFSEILGLKCRLVFMPDDSIREVKPDYIQDEIVSFADGYPYLLTNVASLNQLNEQLPQPVSMDRFRPNVVIFGNHPFEEDHWNQITIGQHQFTTPKPCARCQVVNINPATAKSSKEVLKTLSTFRREGNKVMFGMNGCWLGDGECEIEVGDEVKVK